MASELLDSMNLVLCHCCEIVRNRDVENYDSVVSSLEMLSHSIRVQDSVEEISWAEEFLGYFKSIIKQAECVTDPPSVQKVGRPKIEIDIDAVKELMSLRLSVSKIAILYGVSKRTLFRRLQENDLKVSQFYTEISQEELESKVCEILKVHPYTGYKRMLGFLAAAGIRVTVETVRKTMRVCDPFGTEERKCTNRAIHRRVYFVAHAMELWHLDTNMKLTKRYKMIIRSAIDGNSRCSMYIRIGTDNRATSSLNSFLYGIKEFGVPKRIRMDKGTENGLVTLFMLTMRPNSNCVVTGRSVHNQRIERFWGDLYNDTKLFKRIFKDMEQDGILDIDNENHLYVLHMVFIPRIQRVFDEFQKAWNLHSLSTEHQKSPLLLMRLNSLPAEEIFLYNEDVVDKVYNYCISTHQEEPYVEDPVRNPGPVLHRLSQDQIQRLSEIDVLKESHYNGVDIFIECLNIINEGFE